jgi:hypothetical protein
MTQIFLVLKETTARQSTGKLMVTGQCHRKAALFLFTRQITAYAYFFLPLSAFHNHTLTS